MKSIGDKCMHLIDWSRLRTFIKTTLGKERYNAISDLYDSLISSRNELRDTLTIQHNSSGIHEHWPDLAIAIEELHRERKGR